MSRYVFRELAIGLKDPDLIRTPLGRFSYVVRRRLGEVVLKLIATVLAVFVVVFAISFNVVGGIVGVVIGAAIAKYFLGFKIMLNEQKIGLITLWIVLLSILGSMFVSEIDIAIISFFMAFSISCPSAALAIWLNRESSNSA